MKYTGQFKTINDDLIQVDIVTNRQSLPVTELKFSGESPVVISQTSSDGIFTPIKSRGCTISIVTSDEFWDMYSAQSHGTAVTVTNVSENNAVIFNGYLTPCEYNQPLLYINEIELEAVDAVSTLQDFKYSFVNGSTSQLVSVEKIIKHILIDVAGISGGVYVPKLGLMMKCAWDSSVYPTEMEFLSEETFVDSDDAMTCYEVLEEICKFYNLTLVPYGNDVFFIDYEAVAKYNQTCVQYVQETDNLLFKNLVTDEVKHCFIPKHITKSDYRGDDQNIEMDEVFNKVVIEAETEDVEDEDIATDITDEMSSSQFYLYATGLHRKNDNTEWTFISRMFEFGSAFYVQNDSQWRTYSNTNVEFTLGGYEFLDNFSQVHYSQSDAKFDFPYIDENYLFNQIVGQTVLPAQQFSFNSSKSVPYYPNWSNCLFFFPQVEWFNEYLKRAEIPYNDSEMRNKAYWEGLYETHLGGTLPVLRFIGEKEIEYSPTTSETINYLCFTGDLLWQRNGSIGGTDYTVWLEDEANHKYSGTLATVQDLGGQESNAYYRPSSDAEYRKGWDMLKIKLKIGNKYWNGTTWTTTESTAFIPYHKEEVETGNEALTWGGWNKPVCNHFYPTMINKDAFIIPIRVGDGLHGKMILEVFMPKIPYTSQTITENSSGKLRINYKLTPPVIFMKDFSISLASAKANTSEWFKDMSDLDAKNKKGSGSDNDKITYSNLINTNNVRDFDDLSLKVNTYNEKQPISHTYIIEPTEYTGTPDNITSVSKCVYHTQGFYRPHTNTTERQEMNVVNRYVEHHSTAKRIYNCQLRGYNEPFRCFDSSVLGEGKFVIDEQEYDVKMDVNSLKLVEY